MAQVLTTFPQRHEFEKARHRLDQLGLKYRVISPDPGYARVATPSLVMDSETRFRLSERSAEFVCSGWVDYRPAGIPVPADVPPAFADDVFGTAAITVLAPCMADPAKIRLVAHVSGNLNDVFPYLRRLPLPER